MLKSLPITTGNCFSLPVSQGKKLVQRLGTGIGPACFDGGAEGRVVVLTERHFVVLAIDFGSGGDENQFPFFGGGFQNQFRALDIRLDRAHRTFNNSSNPYRRSQVIHDVRLVNHLRQEVTIHNAIEETLQGPISTQMPEVFNGPGAQVIQNNNPVSPQKQGFRQVRPNESRATCNQ